jgi:nitroimidazol reductase NimA-like FMN-containing flavoprotein (pyridoxamine 5'-phosphate oxidase superfamily)
MSPIADNFGLSLLDRGGRLETLDRDECRRLLDSTNIGRLAYCTDFGPRIVPMNYRLVSERLIFRTGMDTEASSYLINRPIAFEVDQVDEFLQTGWSVLVVGDAALMDETSLRLLDLQQSPQPWPEGRRSLVVQLPLTTVTGRRVHPS